ncbi:MAG: undecaprenyl-diphosphate phosphatase, partial [Planctomycetota bacterium]
MLLFEVLILAVVQGIGEFLPISSSGHVVVAASLFDQFGRPMPEKLTLNIVLHLGTLAAILVFCRRRLLELFGRDRRVIGLVLAATLPSAIVAPPMRWFFNESLESALLAGCMFPLTGALLLWTARLGPGATSCGQLTYRRALWIGMFQAFAILPGISRSGATIVAGLRCGLKREEAATFSFLLAIPVIAGAGSVELVGLLQAPIHSGVSVGLLTLG